MIDLPQLRRLYGRLSGLEQALPHDSTSVDPIFASDFDRIVGLIEVAIAENLDDYKLPPGTVYETDWAGHFAKKTVVLAKLKQLKVFLEHGFQVNDSVIEMGALFKSINDEELRNRCADILSAPGNFDRPINQATQVLEDRIRQKSQADRTMTGVPLVNHAINSDPSKSLLIISEVKEEHEGIAHICRGIMLAFRNPTHHQISDKFSREDALSVVGFVDRLLRLIDGAKRKS
ncbi:MAG: TIGR02391 family protein [Parvibaculaceae bacterium]